MKTTRSLKFSASLAPIAAALLMAHPAAGGTYSQQFTSTPADGSIFTSSNGTALLTSGRLQLTVMGTGGTYAAYRLPDLDPGFEISEFTLDYDVMLQGNIANPADGYAITFGNISAAPADLINAAINTGEEGFAVANSLSINFDTYNNSGTEGPSIDCKGNNITVRGVYMGAANSPGGQWITASAGGYPFDGVVRHVYIHWEANTGLDIKITGSGGSLVDVMVDQAVPGFVPSAGNVFVWGARTGGNAETVQIDNVSVTTVPLNPIQTGGPVIEEILVDNANFGLDEECDSGSWVEIYNGQNASQSLNGWFLTDNAGIPNKWAFPASASIPAYGYYTVWVDAKNRTTPQAHANFAMVKTGGYIALARPNLSVASSLTYGQQVEDVSYGALGAAQTLGYFETPTRGVKNSGLQSTGTPLTEEITFSQVGGLFSTNFTLNITPLTTPGATARYTLDNSVPSDASTAWPAGGMSITGSTQVRVRATAPGKLGGPVSSRSFTKLDTSLTNYRGTGQPFKSNLPIIVFNSYGINIDGAGGSPGLRPFRNTYGMSIAVDAGTGFASITGPIDMQNRGGTHLRGETSAGFAQKPYAWEVWDNKELDKAVSLLGWPDESDFVLISNYNDKSVLRNMMPFEMMRRINGESRAMKERYVEVFFKQDGLGNLTYNDYRGIYVLTEKIKRDSDRVNIEKLDPCDGVYTGNPAVDDAGIISGGYIIRKDKASPETAFTTTGGGGFPAQSLQIVEPNAPSTGQLNYISNFMNRFESALYGSGFGDPVNGYAKYIDVDSWIDGHLWVEIFKQIDGYRLSTYMYKDRGGKLKYAPLWDYNLSLGNANYNDGWNYPSWYYLLLGSADYPYHPRLFQDPVFKRRYWDRYWQLRRGPFSNANINATLEGYIAQLKGGVAGNITNGTGAWPSSTPSAENPIGRHNARWQRLGIYDWPNADNFGLRTNWEQTLDYTTINASTNPMNMTGETSFVKSWIIRRLMWMDDMSSLYGTNASTGAYKPPSFSQYGGTVNSGFNLNIGDPNVGTSGTIYYTTNGSDPAAGGGTTLGSTALLVSETGTGKYLQPLVANGGDLLTAGVGAQQWTIVADPPNIANWSNGSAGFGFDNNDAVPPGPTDVLFAPYIATNVNPTPVAFAGCYIRIPFTVTQEQKDTLGALKLRMRYDDAYVAYINGVEVSRKNFSATPLYTSTSIIAHTDSAVILFEDADITSFKNQLIVGQNMLAIHGINATSSQASANGKDFLIQPKLEANLQGAVTLTQTTQVRARVLSSGGLWSPITEANFIINAVPASAANIVVSEINYNPVPPTPAEITAAPSINNANDFEFIEIMNISNQTVDLTNCQITGGVSFSWTTAPISKQTLGPGARMIIAENADGFNARYATKLANVAGTFSGNLSNGGELITLLSATGQAIKSFTYDDAEPWPVDADLDLNGVVVVRGGYTLVLNNPLANPDHTVGSNWRSSAVLGGCPGQADAITYGGPLSGDSDGDGVADIVEYAVGSNPASGASSRLPQMSWQPFDLNGTPQTCLSLSFTRNLNADQVNVWPEVSSNLAAWQDGSVSLTYVGAENNGDGTATMRWRSTQPVASLPNRMFARISVSPSP